MAKRLNPFIALFAAAVLGSLQFIAATHAAGRAGIIRDAEIENTIRAYGTPLFQAAALDREAIRIHIIQNTALNAFVAGGQNIFLTTGLLMRADNAGQVIGVIAHETGHIAGGHLARLEGVVRQAKARMLIAQILAVAVGLAVKDPSATAAVMGGGAQMTLGGLLSFSRAQEQAADQAAIRLLDSTDQSARGMLEFLDILGDQELLIRSRRDPYARTHPLTRDRIAFLRNFVERSPLRDKPFKKQYRMMHRRMQAKLHGFLEPWGHTFKRYPSDDHSVAARYARAIAYSRQSDMRRALPLIDGLIGQFPGDPFFHELKGQILFEHGSVEAALAPYRTAVDILPHEPLFLMALAQVEIELNRTDLLKPALAHLREALRAEPTLTHAWWLAATAWGRDGRLGMAALALGEYNLLRGQKTRARAQAIRAVDRLKPGSAPWLRAQDIKRAAESRK